MSDSLWPCRRSPPGSYVHAIFQARILEWVAISFSRNSSQPRDWNHVSCVYCIGRRVLYHCATSEDIWYISCRPNINNQILYIDHFLILCRHRMQIILMAIYIYIYISSVQFNHSVVSDSLRPHELQHTRHPCPKPTPGVYSNSCPLSPVMPSNHLILCCPLLLLPSIFANIRIFSNESVLRIRWPSGGQSIGVSALASVLPMNIQDWFPLDGLVGSPCSPRDSQESSPTPHFKSINSLGAQLSI